MTTEQDLAERAEYVRSHITDHITSRHGGGPTPNLTWSRLTADQWRILPGLSAVDLACGWTSPVLEDQGAHPSRPELPIVVRFCPEIIVATTAQLSLSPEPGGHKPWVDLPITGVESISYVDNYVRFVEHLLDMEIVYWDSITDPVLRRQAAEADLYEANPAALKLISIVQSAALWAVTG